MWRQRRRMLLLWFVVHFVPHAAPSPLAAEDLSPLAGLQHWAFQPITDPPVPRVADTTWPQTSIDRFILARLEQAGLRASPAADRRTLIRRAYYDLVGLPPTWTEVQSFVDDPRPRAEAFADIVDHLLASSRYGERWGRHWLDVARYADTKDGVLMYGDDRMRPFAYTYRDYVIRAFNEDLPFDQFIHEQLAADQLGVDNEPWRLAAMGFLTLGRMYDNNVHDIIDDQIDTVTRGLLGLSVACARCHDHKYDPIPTADYYSLYGVFASSEAPLELPLIEPSPGAPESQEFEKDVAAKRVEIREFLDQQYKLLSETARDRVADYLVHVATTEPDPLELTVYFLSLAPDDLRPPIIARWRALLQQRAMQDDPVFGPWGDLMEVFNGRQHGSDSPAAAVEVLQRWYQRPAGTRPGQLNPLVREALSTTTLTCGSDVARVYGELLKHVYEQSLAATVSPADEPRQQLLDLVVSQQSPLWFPKSQTRTYMSRGEKDAFGGKLQELDRMAVKSEHALSRAMVLHDAEVLLQPRIFERGNASRPGEVVPRQFLAALSQDGREPFSHGSGRLDLARAITSMENPLTSRVIVNRVWMHHFGEPLVATPSDFGTRGTPPTHPELLDHLSRWFMREGWSLKKLHRRLMLSSVYQQASSIPGNGEVEFVSRVSAKVRQVESAVRRDDGHSIDPENRFLWRASRRRLDFEAMRDTLLAVSGRLEQRFGGRPVDIVSDPSCRCRTVYGLVDRQSLPGVFRSFDFASPDHSVARRPHTTVPQQALFALNSPFMIEQVQAVAARPEIAAIAEPDAKIVEMYRLIFARDPSAEEVALGLEFVQQEQDTESELDRWQQLAHVLLSSNELMFLD